MQLGERRDLALLAVTLSVICHWLLIDVEATDRSVDVDQFRLVGHNDSEANEVLSSNQTDWEIHPHDLLDKPTKFDRDSLSLIYTDRKTLLENVTERAENLSSVKDSFVSQRRDDKASGNTVDDKIGESSYCKNSLSFACLELELDRLIDDLSKLESYNFTEFLQIVRNENATRRDASLVTEKGSTSLFDKVHRYAREHVLKIRVPSDLVRSGESRTLFGAIFQGKSSFLTGFGLGFLAFGLKKLLLPLFIGAQIVKSVLIALFLPSIIGSIGKIVGKGLTSFAQNSQSATAQPDENFEFKDNLDLYNDDYANRQPIGTLPGSAMYNDGLAGQKAEMVSRYGFAVDSRIGSPAYALSDRYYSRHAITQGPAKKQDYKVFHEIPTSSLLLTNYDPFYSPLLSRLDAVFSRLGHTSEGCREYAVCSMYRSPARYAPYSNLVSTQLSRELNELRKPSSDNPDVLRFFRYMRAAKDGQDGLRCEDVYRDCAVARDDGVQGQNQAMLATYQDIDKLVHARKL